MKTIILTTLFAVLAPTEPAVAAEKDTRCFELRTYYAAPGKLDALNSRFRDHTCKLLEKHGIQNIGYWMPLENPDRKLVFMLAYPSREAREQLWKAFMADPDWQRAYKASEVDGKLVAKVESQFLNATDYSPLVKVSALTPSRVFELRTYRASEGNLDALHGRFRDHTLKLFTRHGMTHVGYWTLASGQPGADRILQYMLAHPSQAAAAAAFKTFRADPDWIAAKKASEQKAGGSLTESGPAGVKSEFLAPTDYSPMK